jgi:hypothetical protein
MGYDLTSPKVLRFMRWNLLKNNTPDETGYTMEELKIISEHIIDYLFGRLDTMQVAFEDGNVFSNQALNHMRDVRTLYNGGSIIGWIALAIEIGLGTLIVLHYQYLKHDLLKTTSLRLQCYLASLPSLESYQL